MLTRETTFPRLEHGFACCPSAGQVTGSRGSRREPFLSLFHSQVRAKKKSGRGLPRSEGEPRVDGAAELQCKWTWLAAMAGWFENSVRL